MDVLRGASRMANKVGRKIETSIVDKKKGTGYFFCALIHATCAVRSCTNDAAYVCQRATAVRDDRLASNRHRHAVRNGS